MNSLNLSGKIDGQSIAIYSAIDQTAKELNIPYVVVGASARDLVLHYGYGARIQRATADIDFGIQLPDWGTFQALHDKLIKAGFRETRTRHRLIFERTVVDLVPFGQIQDDEAKIAWPPEGETVMNVMGFQEAMENSDIVILQDDPEVKIPVVMPPGLSLLKIISWSDRDADLKDKDAGDLLYVLKSYQTIPEIQESIYDYPEKMEEFDWNIDLGSAFKLGIDTAEITSGQTSDYLKRIENNQIDGRPVDLLIEDMCDNIEDEFEINQNLLKAYFSGLNLN